MVTLLSKKDQMSHSNVASEMLPRKCCLECDLKTLGLLLRCPNIALMIVRPFQIDPYNSNDGASYFSIVGYHCLKETRSEERRVGKECRSRWSPYH